MFMNNLMNQHVLETVLKLQRLLSRCVKCKATLFDHPYPWTTLHRLRTIYNVVNEEKYKIYYNGEKLKQIETTEKDAIPLGRTSKVTDESDNATTLTK